MNLPPGTQLGKYELIKLLAFGGMAEVYAARATAIGGFERIVVIKRILPHLAKDKRFVAMFLEEIRLSASLHHRNIVQVYDVGVFEGVYFSAMEYIHGRDARSVLTAARKRDERLPLDVALTIATELSAGLDHAHNQRAGDGTPLDLVHRDVSPANVLLGYDGSVKLADFGVAKVTALKRTKTATGSLKGKVGYMSPEQCEGREDLDRRSDVFALGIVLYELTTGHKPFQGSADFAIITKIVNGDYPPPSQYVPDYPPILADIIGRALSTNRADRFETAGALHDAVEDFAEAHGTRLGTSKLRRYMASLFGDQMEGWQSIEHAGVEELRHMIKTPTPRPRTNTFDSNILKDVKEHVAQAVQARDGTPIAAPSLSLSSGRNKKLGAVLAACAAIAVVAAIGITMSRGDSTSESAGPADDIETPKPATQAAAEPDEAAEPAEPEQEAEPAADPIEPEPVAAEPVEPEPAAEPAEPEPAAKPAKRTRVAKRRARKRSRAKKKRAKKKSTKKKWKAKDSPFLPEKL